MVLDIQTVHHILKNTAVQNVNKPFVYITDLTSTLNKVESKLSYFHARIWNQFISIFKRSMFTDRRQFSF
jgi:hypothetical protein